MSSSIESDYLVIGTGIAGLSFALKAAEVGAVTVITKKESRESNTNYAQGGIASVLAPDDSFDLHTRDTLDAGAGLCRKEVVDLVVRAGPRMVQELMDWGVRFTREANQGETLALGREGGHSMNRIAYSADLTGREIERALTEAVAAHPNIRQFEHHAAIDLITEHHLFGSEALSERAIHCYALDAESAEVIQFVARATILCSGGAGQIYEHTTNPKIATGDGIAMAYRAGASVGNFEFVQFHPTTLYCPGANSFLISEAVRGHGGVLVNKAGEHFMDGTHPLSSLAPRDIVARAIDSEMKKSGEPCVFLDITHVPADEVRERFPNIHERCLSFGIDITKDLIPVVPAAHYACGGVFTDTWGRTDIRGLFASGEVACMGLHGANRLASNVTVGFGGKGSSTLPINALSQLTARTTLGTAPGFEVDLGDTLITSPASDATFQTRIDSAYQISVKDSIRASATDSLSTLASTGLGFGFGIDLPLTEQIKVDASVERFGSIEEMSFGVTYYTKRMGMGETNPDGVLRSLIGRARLILDSNADKTFVDLGVTYPMTPQYTVSAGFISDFGGFSQFGLAIRGYINRQ